jgi:hypothetical protein
MLEAVRWLSEIDEKTELPRGHRFVGRQAETIPLSPHPVLAHIAAEAAAQEDKSDDLDHFGQGVFALQAGRFAEALEKLSIAIKENPEDVEAYQQRAMAYLGLNRAEDALADAHRAVAMMAVHELGHVLGAVATGGRVERVVLHPLTISRTDVSPNPCPLLVVWAGPVVGVLLPLALLLIAKVSKLPWAYMLQFFAGFCLVANGAYIGFGSFGKIGDAGDMLCHGSPIWSLWLFGVVTLPLGLYLWNGLGPHFGLGAAAGKVDHWTAYASCGLLLVSLVLEVALCSR